MTVELLKGDCLERMSDIADGSIDLILADPPYEKTVCKWDVVIPLEPMWKQLLRVTKPDGAIVIMANQPFTTVLIASNMDMFKYCWYWDKVRPSNHLNAKIQPMRLFEDIAVFYRKQPTYNPIMVKRDEPVVGRDLGTQRIYGETSGNYSKVYTDKYPNGHLVFYEATANRIHPSQKPVALMEYLIATYTEKDDVVLDFAMGGGTTGVAAGNLDRSFVGIEIDDAYFELAAGRIEDCI